MTLHVDELMRLGVNRNGGQHSHRDAWHRPARSEVVLPSPGSLASVLVLGLFALSLSGVGILYQLIRIGRRR